MGDWLNEPWPCGREDAQRYRVFQESVALLPGDPYFQSPHAVVAPFASCRKARTAVTRRLTDRSSDRPSFEKIVLTYFSTEDSDRWRAIAIATLDLPSAITRSTSTSRTLSKRSEDSACRAR